MPSRSSSVPRSYNNTTTVRTEQLHELFCWEIFCLTLFSLILLKFSESFRCSTSWQC
jgi:hypothetical protein